MIAAGFADFSLIAFHFQKTATVQGLVPVFYAVAMASGAVASLVLGKLLDKLGLPILLVAFGVPAFFAPLVFLRGTTLELVGMILWGIGMGAQDSCLKAVRSAVVPSDKRSTAFGIFDTGFISNCSTWIPTVKCQASLHGRFRINRVTKQAGGGRCDGWQNKALSRLRLLSLRRT